MILTLCLLAGCSTLRSLAVNNYDPIHYQLITEIRFIAHKNHSDCDNTDLSRKNAIELSDKSNFFQLYTEQLPSENDMINAAKELNNMIIGLADQYKSQQQPHAEFCRIKFQNIENSAISMQKILGARPR